MFLEKFSLRGKMAVGPVDRLTLTRFETRIRLADHVNAAFTAHDLTIGVTMFERLE
jgi:hypothetical protein